MLGFANLHVLSIKHGEVYVHHFWLLWVLIYLVFSSASSHISGRK